MKLPLKIPIVSSAKRYNVPTFKKDLFAALNVLIVLVPQAMAYSLIAGMPPIYGLYSAFIPLILYGILGTSPQLSIGPVAISSLLVYAGLVQIAEPMTQSYIELALLLGLAVGIFQIMLGFLKLGFMANYMSLPVINGFVSGAAILIIFSQVKHILGVTLPKETSFIDGVLTTFEAIPYANLLAVIPGILSIVIIILVKKRFPKLPVSLLLVIIFTVISYYLQWESKGIRVVGEVTSGLPSFMLPSFHFSSFKILLPTIIAVSLIGVVESVSIAKFLEQKQNDYTINVDQELKAYGFSKIFGAFFQSYPTSGSFTRSTINSQSGAMTGFSSIFLAIFTGLVLLFFTDVFVHIPYFVLGAIIIASVYKLVDVHSFVTLRKVLRRDWFAFVITFLVTLLVGIEYGVLSGIMLSFAVTLLDASRPHVAELGHLKLEDTFKNITRFKEAETDKNYIIFRMDERLFFGNADYFREQAIESVKRRKITPDYFIFCMQNVSAIDTTGIDALKQFNNKLEEKGIQLIITTANGPVRDIFIRTRFFSVVKPKFHFANITAAIEYINEGIQSGENVVDQYNKKKDNFLKNQI